jgi:type VI secretion system protein VasD
MTIRQWHPALAATLIALTLTTACAKQPPPQVIAGPPEPPKLERPVEAHLTISTAADANPDATGRPSPVVVRLYQLKGDTAFTAAEFFGLFDNEQQELGPALISRAELMLEPSELRTLDLAVDGDARFVGMLAAFRDIRNAQWRVIVPTWREGLKHMTVAVERARIVATVAEPQLIR